MEIKVGGIAGYKGMIVDVLDIWEVDGFRIAEIRTPYGDTDCVPTGALEVDDSYGN